MSLLFGEKKVLIFGGLGASGYGYFADGTLSLPSISFINDTNTGFYRNAADTVAFTSGGVASFSMLGGASGGITFTALGTNQNITLTPSGTGQAVISAARNGAVLQINNLSQNGGIVITRTTTGAGSSSWQTTTNGGMQLTADAADFTVGAGGVTSVIAISTSPTTNSIHIKSGNSLFGTSTDSSNGRLQLAAHVAATGGIGFGTATSLFTTATGVPAWNASTGTDMRVLLQLAGSSLAQWGLNGGNTYMDYNGSMIFRAGLGGTTALTLDASQRSIFAQAIVATTTTRSGAGAISATSLTTKLTSTGVAEAITLADGIDGQIKTIIHDVDGGSMVLTPATATGYTTITFTNAGESATLQFVTTRGWSILSLRGAIAA